MGIVLLLLSLVNAKIRSNYYNSYKQIFKLLLFSGDIKNSNKKVLMFHAASAGEYEQIKPILRGINRTEFFIVQTFTSSTIYNIESVSGEDLYDIKCYHPFDVFWLSYSFFKIIRPKKYIITRHDLWPGHILMANHFQIPIYYINANIHQNSIWYNQSLKGITKYFFNKIHRFIVPSIYIKENLYNILPTIKPRIIQDTRFNQIIHLKCNRGKLTNKYDIPRNEVITFGSIDDLDEKLIFKILPAITKEKKVILVPHEVDRKTIHRIEKQLNKLSISYARFSTEGIMNFSKQVILIDTLGLLAHLYSMGTHAYVGGGFKRGVHSVLEPAAYNCLIACGPNIEMLDEAKLLKDSGHLSIIQEAIDLTVFTASTGSGPNIMDNVSAIPSDMINVLVSDSRDNYNILLNQQ